MKTNVLFIAALLLVSSSAFAAENPGNSGFVVVAKSSDVFKVIYKNDRAEGRIKMNIYDPASQLIYSETVSGGGFILPLKFSGLAPGAYRIEIADGSARYSETVNYQPEKVAGASKKVVHVTRITGEDEKYLVSVANVSGGRVTINIYDTFDRLVHNETREISGEFAQIYTVKNKKVSSIEVIDEAGNSKVSRF